MTDYLVTMDTGERFLVHHGVKGMKWGVWNEETRARYSGYVYPKGKLPKDTQLARWSRKSAFKDYKHDPLSGNVKYVSTNINDHEKWKELFDSDHKHFKEPRVTSETLYKTVNDLKIADADKLGKLYKRKVHPKLSDDAKSEEQWYWEDHVAPRLKIDPNQTTLNEALSPLRSGFKTSKNTRNLLAANSLRFTDVEDHAEVGKRLVEELKKRGYGGTQDAIGWDTAADPVILLDPKNNLQVLSENKINGKNNKSRIKTYKVAYR